MDFAKGRLVVATPLLGDPNFERGVVFMLEHSEEGAVGLVLNRPSEVEVDTPLADWRRFASHPEVVFVGGPVNREAVIALARVQGSEPEEAWQRITGSMGVLDLTADADLIGGAIDQLRIFAGYAGWGPEQLEGEIDEGAWFVVDAHPDDPFGAEPEELWRTVLRRQPDPLRRYALFPPDLRMN
ncbi:MAG: YqgE/AlgH family protein [Acidimicrobiales bacterium]